MILVFTGTQRQIVRTEVNGATMVQIMKSLTDNGFKVDDIYAEHEFTPEVESRFVNSGHKLVGYGPITDDEIHERAVQLGMDPHPRKRDDQERRTGFMKAAEAQLKLKLARQRS